MSGCKLESASRSHVSAFEFTATVCAVTFVRIMLYIYDFWSLTVLFILWTRDFFSFPKRPDRLWGPPSLLFNGYRGTFPEVKWPEREVNHSSPSSAEIKNEWSYTSAPHICLHGMERESFTNRRFTVDCRNLVLLAILFFFPIFRVNTWTRFFFFFF
jgi:hypothetical protein